MTKVYLIIEIEAETEQQAAKQAGAFRKLIHSVEIDKDKIKYRDTVIRQHADQVPIPFYEAKWRTVSRLMYPKFQSVVDEYFTKLLGNYHVQ